MDTGSNFYIFYFIYYYKRLINTIECFCIDFVLVVLIFVSKSFSVVVVLLLFDGFSMIYQQITPKKGHVEKKYVSLLESVLFSYQFFHSNLFNKVQRDI